MWYQESTDTVYNYKKPVTVDGIRYSANVFGNPTVLSSIGIYPAEYADFDEQYYIKGAETKEFIDAKWIFSWEQVPKEFEQVQKELISKNVQSMDERLARTDKYIVRQEEIDIYAGTFLVVLNNWRNAVYEAYNFKLSEIKKAVTTKDLQEAEQKILELPEEPDFASLYLEQPLLN